MKNICNILKEYLTKTNPKSNIISRDLFTKYIIIEEDVSIHTVKAYFQTLKIFHVAQINKEELKINLSVLTDILRKQKAKKEGWF